MAQNLKGRSLLTLGDFTASDVRLMLDTAREYKRLKYAGIPHRIHEGKNIALLFEKASTRTRCAFTVAANDLGIAPEYLGKDDIQLGKKKPSKIRRKCSDGCLTVSSFAGLRMRRLRNWLVTLAYRFGMA